MNKRRNFGVIMTLLGAIGIAYTYLGFINNDLHGDAISGIIMIAILLFFGGVSILRNKLVH